jgi:broad specificity phosphatase PhoE
MPVDEAKKTYPDAEEFYQGRTTEIDAPGVEAIPILQKRSADAIRRIAAQNKGKNIGVVSHLFWTKALLSELLGQPFSEIQKTRVGTASLTTIEAVHTPNGIKFVVSEIGDERHLERLKT